MQKFSFFIFVVTEWVVHIIVKCNSINMEIHTKSLLQTGNQESSNSGGEVTYNKVHAKHISHRCSPRYHHFCCGFYIAKRIQFWSRPCRITHFFKENCFPGVPHLWHHSHVFFPFCCISLYFGDMGGLGFPAILQENNEGTNVVCLRGYCNSVWYRFVHGDCAQQLVACNSHTGTLHHPSTPLQDHRWMALIFSAIQAWWSFWKRPRSKYLKKCKMLGTLFLFFFFNRIFELCIQLLWFQFECSNYFSWQMLVQYFNLKWLFQ